MLTSHVCRLLCSYSANKSNIGDCSLKISFIFDLRKTQFAFNILICFAIDQIELYLVICLFHLEYGWSIAFYARNIYE